MSHKQDDKDQKSILHSVKDEFDGLIKKYKGKLESKFSEHVPSILESLGGVVYDASILPEDQKLQSLNQAIESLKGGFDKAKSKKSSVQDLPKAQDLPK